MKFIDKKYKNIKFYGNIAANLQEIKKLRKQLKKLNPEDENYEQESVAIQEKLDYINVGFYLLFTSLSSTLKARSTFPL